MSNSMSALQHDFNDIYGSFLNKSYLYVIEQIITNGDIPKSYDVLDIVYLPFLGELKIKDLISDFSAQELKIFEIFVSSNSIDSLRLDTFFNKESVESLRNKLFSYLIEFEQQIKVFLKEKLGFITGRDYVMTSRIKTFNSIIFNRISTLKPIQDIPDILGSRIVINNIDNLKEIKKVFIDVEQSPIVINTKLKSHVWDNESGYRDTTLYDSYNYQSFDLFVSPKSEQNNKSLFYNIDIQIRTTKNDNKINLSPANHTFYKNKQLYSFLLKFLLIQDFRNRVLEHMADLVDEVLNLSV